MALVQTLGLSIDLSELNPIKGGELRVFSNYSSGFRAPNLDDLGTLGIVDFRYEVPQYDLRPEYSKNHEIGFKFRSREFELKFLLIRTIYLMSYQELNQEMTLFKGILYIKRKILKEHYSTV